ncbi:hypothetical protein ABTZ17_22210, partial [Streptomyces sp. NPDC097619]
PHTALRRRPRHPPRHGRSKTLERPRHRTSHEVPYASIRKVEVDTSGGLTVVPKQTAETADTEGYASVGFAGSLLDRLFKTSEKAAAEIALYRKHRRHVRGADGPVRRKLTGDTVAEAMLLLAAICPICAALQR